jgi:hypothetical protein
LLKMLIFVSLVLEARGNLRFCVSNIKSLKIC